MVVKNRVSCATDIANLAGRWKIAENFEKKLNKY